MKELILKLDSSNCLETSKEGIKINKLISSISPLNFIKLLKSADNKVNPRIAKINGITRSIHETLENSPELFWFKSKGLLLATKSCTILERNRIQISFEDKEFEGIMDGGHNTFAIAIYMIEKLFGKKIKTWSDCKLFWEERNEEIISLFNERSEEFKFSIPIEIITPSNIDGAEEEYFDYISEICSARNNNVQLKETAKGNQVGYYDYLKKLLPNHNIIWKAGDSGAIKCEDIISLSTLPLIFLKNNNLLPKDLKNLNKISLYSQKSKCVDFFNKVMAHEEVSVEVKGKYILKDSYIKSALSLTDDIIKFFDIMYIEFPNLYHKASPGKFGRISSVNNKNKGNVPFKTLNKQSDYQYSHGFFYPLICGITSLMNIDEETKEVKWKKDLTKLDLKDLNLVQYVNIIKLVNFDPQKIGKGEVFYTEAESVFEKLSAK